jgi:hypothetical protein
MKITKTGMTIATVSVVLAACAAPGGTTVPQMTTVNYYPQCYQSVGQLRQEDQQFQQTMAVNTIGGALTGAALGGLITGNWRGAALGALAGGMTAATATYASARAQEADDERRRLMIANDLSHDSSEMQRAVLAARQADNCYGYAYAQLVAGVRRGAISKPEAAQRFAEIDQGEHEVAAILTQYGKKSMASAQQYQAAFDQEAQRLNTSPTQLLADAGSAPPPSSSSHARAPAPAPRATAHVSQNTRQLAQNYNRLNQQVSEINQEQSTIEHTATARRNDMQGLGVEVPS